MAGRKSSSESPEVGEVERLVWEGSIPLRIELAAKEVTTLTPPPPLFIMAPRLGYLPLLASKIEPHFRAALPPGTDTIWFKHNGLPLKWHIPAGVLYDLLVEDKTLPWRLTVHFRTFPNDTLIPIEGEETVKWSYMNALKEAVYIMHGSTKLVMGLSQRDQEELWRAIAEGDFEAHAKAAATLRPPASGISRPRSVPLRLYLRQAAATGTPIGKWDEVAITTRCADGTGNGLPITLGGALHNALPQLFNGETSDTVAGPTTELGRRLSNLDIEPSTSRRGSMTGETTDSPRIPISDSPRNVKTPSRESGETTGATPSGEKSEKEKSPSGGRAESPGATGGQEPEAAASGETEPVGGAGSSGEGKVGSGLGEETFAERFVVRIQGTEPRWDVPLDWLSRKLSHPDQFLHICLWKR